MKITEEHFYNNYYTVAIVITNKPRKKSVNKSSNIVFPYKLFYDHVPCEFLNVCLILNHIHIVYIPIATWDNIIIPTNSIMIE